MYFFIYCGNFIEFHIQNTSYMFAQAVVTHCLNVLKQRFLTRSFSDQLQNLPLLHDVALPTDPVMKFNFYFLEASFGIASFNHSIPIFILNFQEDVAWKRVNLRLYPWKSIPMYGSQSSQTVAAISEYI